MITKILMPKLSEAMETGKVIKWLKKEGDAIKGGDVIAEIETDKANVEIEAFGSGVLRKIIVGEGGQVPVGDLIGVIAEPSDDISTLAASVPSPAPAAAAPAGGGRVKASPLARKVAAQSGMDLRLIQGSGPGGRIVRRDVEAAGTAPATAP